MILIAENDPSVGGLLQMVLEQRELSCELAVDGKKAWKRLRSGDYSVLVTDLDMPGIDGHGLLERLAELAEPPAVLVVSGFVDPPIEARLRSHPAVVRIFRKPFDLMDFADEVGQLVGCP